MLLNMVFSVEFDETLYFQGFERIFGVRMMIFDGVKSDEILDFVEFYRSGYRSDFDDFLVFFDVGWV